MVVAIDKVQKQKIYLLKHLEENYAHKEDVPHSKFNGRTYSTPNFL